MKVGDDRPLEGTNGEAAAFAAAVRLLEEGDVWRSAECFERFDGLVAPPSRKYRDLALYRVYEDRVRRGQIKAEKHGVPGFLITSLPQSASGFFTEGLSRLYKARVVNVAAGSLFLTKFDVILRRWLETALRSCITHSHFSASPHNLATLSSAGAKRLLVQVRDPRQAVYSHFAKAFERLDKYPEWHSYRAWAALPREEALRRAYYENFLLWCKWLLDWLEVADCADWLALSFVDFRQVRDDLAAWIEGNFPRRLAERFGWTAA